MVRSKTPDQPTAFPVGQSASGPGNAVLPNPKNGALTGSQQEASTFPDGMLGVDVGGDASESRLVEDGTRFDTSTNYDGYVNPNSKSLVSTADQVPNPDLINRGYTEVPGAVNTGPILMASANRSKPLDGPGGNELAAAERQDPDLGPGRGPVAAGDAAVPGMKYNSTTHTT